MLAHLSIRDIVLIERLEIDFSAGLSVLTGETGAGKSILLDSLSLALGARGDASLVRQGASQGQVTALFDVANDHPARHLLRENAIEEEGDLILRRVQSADGRTRGFINDQPASMSLMREVGRHLVEIHGQHDERALVDESTHRILLDAFGGHWGALKLVRQAWKEWRQAENELARHRARVEAAAREADYLRASVDELSKLEPMPGEEEELAETRARMMRAEKLATEIDDAREVLSGPSSAVPQLASLLRRLQRKSEEAPGLLEPIIETLDQALLSLDATQGAVEDALRAAEFDPAVLERSEERLFALRAAARKYSIQVEDLAALRDRMADELAALDAGEERLGQLEQAARDTRATYDAAAMRLSEDRSATAAALAGSVMAELPALKLERAEFIVEMTSEPEDRGEDGIDSVEFWVRTNPGTRAGPIMKIASGGELSRFLLALKVALADRGSAPTLVFDEIDTGVGGAVADAIGQRLARLAQRVQVLSVTHAPQVAARAVTHYLISKSGGSDSVSTGIRSLEIEARREEIARMLAGATITEEARAAAGRLLQENSAAV
ncbi:MAG: DNA repair protein RecN [Rhizobiaceae bacterium]